VTHVAGLELTQGSPGAEVSDDNPAEGTVDVFPADRKANSKSATKILWRSHPSNPAASLSVVVETRSRRKRSAPTSCGALLLNDGASLFEIDPLTGEPKRDGASGELLPPLFTSEALLLVAVEDLDGGGIVRDGSGDEDGDGRSDLEEVRNEPLTDACLADSDEDGLNDGEEVDLGTDPNDPDSDGDGFPTATTNALWKTEKAAWTPTAAPRHELEEHPPRGAAGKAGVVIELWPDLLHARMIGTCALRWKHPPYLSCRW